MAIIKLLLFGRKKPVGVRQRTLRQAEAPLRSVRRAYLFLGAPYSVALKQGTRNSLKAAEGQWTVTLHTPTRAAFEAFMDGWLRRAARKEFQRAVDRWIPAFHAAGYALPAPRIKIFRMRRAWGRCYYTKGLVTLNLHLIQAPRPHIEYIVLHELCHFVVHNHSRDFYRLLEGFLPHWKQLDLELKQFARQHRIIR